MKRSMWTGAAMAAAVALVMSGCQFLPLPTKEHTPEPEVTESEEQSQFWGAEDAAVYDQELDWTTCGEFQCAEAQVPLSWDDPDGPTITLALKRAKAQDRKNRVGSLLINPGGPGGSGVDLVEYFTTIAGQDLLDAYDVVGFDPRGVGQSTPVECGTPADVDAFLITDEPTITIQEDLDAVREASAAFARLCHDTSGDLMENVDTTSAARDMDVLRSILGDESLHYLGFSYGTQLGATYAELFPGRVGRVVLDGAVDFLIPGEEQSLQQAGGFEQALTAFIEWCHTQSDCTLDGNTEEARAEIAAIAQNARDYTYPTSWGGVVNGNLMAYGIIVTLYDEGSWPYLSLALAEVQTQQTADIAYELANIYLDRDSVTGEYTTNSSVAFPAIGCLDGGGEEWTLEQQLDYAARANQVAPTLGWWFGGAGSCVGWPWASAHPVTSLDTAKEQAAPMLVIGTTGDPATPFAWAESLADALGATLLTYNGEGHTAYGRSNQCVVDVVDAYLVDGVLPDAGTTC